MGLEWYMNPNEFSQARRLPGRRLCLYGTYKTNSLIYIICTFLGNQEDVVIEFSGREERVSSHPS